MLRTVRLFDTDSYISVFDATVLSCNECTYEDKPCYAVILDQTSFYPEGGGQGADKGKLNGIDVLYVSDENGIITHITNTPLNVGDKVHGTINFKLRFMRMQNHSGEHIVSGLVHRLYGYKNVGFHLGDGYMTFDFNGYLDRAQLNMIEDMANAVVWENAPIKAYYPTKDELQVLEYRSKLDLVDNVRIVKIGDCDVCACSAPHVKNTGEIGIIKLLDAVKYKGGVRINALCGSWALEDYRKKYADIAHIASDMSVSQNDITLGYARLKEALDEKKFEIAQINSKLIDITLDGIKETDGSLLFIYDDLDAVSMRKILNRAAQKCTKLCGVFVGNDADGYRYVIGRGKDVASLKEINPHIISALSAKGGGSKDMLQGSSNAAANVIQKFFDEY